MANVRTYDVDAKVASLTADHESFYIPSQDEQIVIEHFW
jgi:hypothetical protein